MSSFLLGTKTPFYLNLGKASKFELDVNSDYGLLELGLLNETIGEVARIFPKTIESISLDAVNNSNHLNNKNYRFNKLIKKWLNYKKTIASNEPLEIESLTFLLSESSKLIPVMWFSLLYDIYIKA